MNIIELNGISANLAAPKNIISASDRAIARFPNHPNGDLIGKYWWQADRGFLAADKETGYPVWYDRLAPGARFKGLSSTWPTRTEEFTSTAATGSVKQPTYAVAGQVEMDAADILLDANANTLYAAVMMPLSAPAGLVRFFGPRDNVAGAAPTDDVFAAAFVGGTPRMLSDDNAASILAPSPATDYRGSAVVVRWAKSSTYGASIAVNGVEIARDVTKNAPLIDRTVSLFNTGSNPAATKWHGTIRHLFLVTGADTSADPFFSSIDAAITTRFKADLGIV